MQKRLYFVLMALVVISMLVAACGGGETTPTEAPAPTAAPVVEEPTACLLYTSPSPRDRTRSRMPSSA